MLDEEPQAGPARFILDWIYCTVIYDFVFGFFLGWIPALILALLVAVAMIYLRPLAAIAILCGCIQCMTADHGSKITQVACRAIL
jgi:hypothetical protein